MMMYISQRCVIHRRCTSGTSPHTSMHTRRYTSHRIYGTPGDTHQAQGIWHTRRYTSPHTSVHTQIVHQEAHRPPQSRCIYSLCNRMHEYISLLTYTCIHGWPTDRNTSPHINVHTWCVHQEVHKPPRMHVHAYTACAPKCVHA